MGDEAHREGAERDGDEAVRDGAERLDEADVGTNRDKATDHAAVEDGVGVDGVGADEGGQREDGAAMSGVDSAIVEAFETELADAKRKADENHDLYLRAEADLQTLRRVGETRKREAVDRTRRDLLTSFLEIADDLEKAIAFGEADRDKLLAGIETTMRAFRHIFEREGVKRIEAENAVFDPAVHEAVGVVPMPGVDGERVISVERTGYTIGDDLLRAARVVVGRAPEEG